MVKIASIVTWFSGLGFGVPCLYGIWTLWKSGRIAYVMGFPTYGYGPFGKIGVETTIPLLLGFLLTCGLECLSGYMLWSAEKGGAMLSFAIIPLELAFYIGFALPFGPPFVLIRIILVLMTWSQFKTF
jgi:hypothetical protein